MASSSPCGPSFTRSPAQFANTVTWLHTAAHFAHLCAMGAQLWGKIVQKRLYVMDFYWIWATTTAPPKWVRLSNTKTRWVHVHLIKHPWLKSYKTECSA